MVQDKTCILKLLNPVTYRAHVDVRWIIKVGWRSELSRDAAVTLACKSLWEAADSDSATGGPDALRAVYPIVATITNEGWSRVDDTELSPIFESFAEEMRSR